MVLDRAERAVSIIVVVSSTAVSLLLRVFPRTQRAADKDIPVDPIT